MTQFCALFSFFNQQFPDHDFRVGTPDTMTSCIEPNPQAIIHIPEMIRIGLRIQPVERIKNAFSGGQTVSADRKVTLDQMGASHMPNIGRRKPSITLQYPSATVFQDESSRLRAEIWVLLPSASNAHIRAY